MSKAHADAQNIAAKIYGEARKQALAALAKHIGKLDALYAADADALKAELRKLFKQSGIPQRRATKLVDDILGASRAKRVKVVREAIIDAAKAAHGLDSATFNAIFSPKEVAQARLPLSGSPQSETRSLRLVSASEDEPPETD
jgi:hypothetical protein